MFRDYLYKTLLLLSTIILMGFSDDYGDAYEKSTDRYVVIDVDKVITQSRAYKRFKILWDRENSKYQKEIEFYENQIVALDNRIINNVENSTIEDLNKLKHQLGSHEIRVQKLIQKRKIYLDELFGNALEKLKTNITKIVQRYAKDNDITLVIAKSQTIYVDEKFNITDKTIEILDKELNKIDMKIK